MKKIDTVIHAQSWDLARATLENLTVSVTLREIKTFGRTPPRREVYRGSVYVLETTPELELTLLVRDEWVEVTISALQKAIGNLEFVVTPVEYFGRNEGEETNGLRQPLASRPALPARPAAVPSLAVAIARA